MGKVEIRNLEIHVSHSCNLACESCSHYSNQGHKGVVTAAEADAWMAHWSDRIAPHKFTLLGGEPAINPQLVDIVRITRARWPDAMIRLVSNGFLLHRQPELPRALAEAGNVVLEISVHHASPAYTDRLAPTVEMLRGWARTYRFPVRLLPSFGNWTRRYKGIGADMEPYEDEKPRESWEHCPARYCPQIFEAKIWKCAPIAYLRMQHEKYGLSDKWQGYLTYDPLEPGCTDAELVEFFSREEEPVCAMCPASPEKITLPLPYPAKLAKQREAA